MPAQEKMFLKLIYSKDLPENFGGGLVTKSFMFIADANREIEAQVTHREGLKSANFDLQLLSNVILPVETSAFSLNIKNALTDYDFALENLSFEIRLEKTSSGSAANVALNNGYGNSGYGNNYGSKTIKTTFEVLDWKNLRLDFALSEQVRKTLDGRRIQFRIRDRDRGDSDWYTVKQTFVRTPRIEGVRCTNEMSGQCAVSGEGIDYIVQVSVDGGVNWQQNETGRLQVQTSASGLKTVMVPAFTNKKMLMIKLRDYPQADGLWVVNYTFVNTIKTTKTNKLINPQPSEKKIGNQSSPVTNLGKTSMPAISPGVPLQSSVSTQGAPNLSNFLGMPGYPPSPKTKPSPSVSKAKRKPKI